MAEATLHDTLALMRLNKPVGIWLVFFPAAWGVLLSPAPLRPVLLIAMLLGAVLARSAGCIINDLTDRRLDATVTRTKKRPLASGAVPVVYAYLLLALLGALGLALAAWLHVLPLALLAVPMIAAYPWMKRITWWPQLFLGLTFNLGALMGWLATGAPLTMAPLLLYAASICWTLGYDTLYALQDMADDRKAGMKSTALFFKGNVLNFVAAMYIVMQVLLIGAAIVADTGPFVVPGLLLIGLQMRWQVRLLQQDGTAAGGRLFQSNQWLGLMFFACLLAGKMLH